MKIQSLKIKCPVCGCVEIRHEYDGFGFSLLPNIFNPNDDENVPIWCYCPSCGCGIMFSSVWEEFAA